jgi:hypothetical protein
MRRLIQPLLPLLVCVVSATSEAQHAANVVICKKNSSGAITLRNKRCISGEQKISNISSLVGSQGEDGSLRVYGDGSAGALHVTSSIDLQDPNQQFTDITIDPGQQLFVESGAVIRCTGTFRNQGTVYVAPSGYGSNTDTY